MKKCLLIAIAITLTVSGFAQNKMANAPHKTFVPRNKEYKMEKSQGDRASVLPRNLLNHRRAASGANSVQTTATMDTLGSALNYRTVALSNRTNVWYDKDLNTVTFVHRGRGAAIGEYNSNRIDVDWSKDGGQNWVINQTAWEDTSYYNYIFYPQGIINNADMQPLPVSGDSGYLYWEGRDYINIPPSQFVYVHGDVYGATKLDSANNYVAAHYDTLRWPMVTYFAEDIFSVKGTNDIWRLGYVATADTTGGETEYTYADSIFVSHLAWNTATKDYDSVSTQHIYVPVKDTGSFFGPIDMNIVFDDFGNNGYIVMILNNDQQGAIYPDSLLYLSVLKTNNSGATWTYASNALCTRPDITIDVSTAVDPVMGNDPSNRYGIMFDMDPVMDMNSNLHIFTGIAGSQGYSVFIADSLFGYFDVYTTDQGATWKVQKLRQPKSFRGLFGANTTDNPNSSQDNRPFASRTWDGDKLFFSWFETDTLFWGTDPNGNNDNDNPDLWSIGYDVSLDQWTDTFNLTRGSDADGYVTFGSGSYYVIDSAAGSNVYSIPTVFAQLAAQTLTGDPIQFWYLENANVNFASTHTGSPINLPLCAPDNVTTHSRAGEFNVSANYPNPFNGKTRFDITLPEASDVTIQISNILGEVISVNKYSNLNSGKHSLTIDGAKLSSGVYVYKVSAGNEVVAKKMTVQ